MPNGRQRNFSTVAFAFWLFILTSLALGSTVSVDGPASVAVFERVNVEVQVTPAPESQNISYVLGDKFFDFREAETSDFGTTVEEPLASGGYAKRGGQYAGVYKGTLPEGVTPSISGIGAAVT